jgi:hypothetical protein
MRADASGISVLSISRHLTVWRHGGTVTWRTSSGRYERLDLADLVDVTEQIVWAHEELVLAEENGLPMGPLALGNLTAAS